MEKNIIELNEKYKSIKNKGWIKSKRSGTSGIGYTFEKLLDKEEENFPIPDFKEIEIKTMHKYSKRNIHLFNLTPDGDYLFPIKRILNILGYPDKDFPMYKVFNMDVDALNYTKVGLFKKMKLVVNRNKKKLELIVVDNKGKKINIDTSWSFESLYERINLKLKYLALIKADSKKINGDEYFYYNQINFYKIKDFDNFINLLEQGYITVTFKISVFKKGKRLGQVHDHGTGFSINEEHVTKLYDEIDINKLQI